MLFPGRETLPLVSEASCNHASQIVYSCEVAMRDAKKFAKQINAERLMEEKYCVNGAPRLSVRLIQGSETSTTVSNGFIRRLRE